MDNSVLTSKMLLGNPNVILYVMYNELFGVDKNVGSHNHKYIYTHTYDHCLIAYDLSERSKEGLITEM